MNIFELKAMIAMLEAENDPANDRLLEIYYKKHHEMVCEITAEINQILKKMDYQPFEDKSK